MRHAAGTLDQRFDDDRSDLVLPLRPGCAPMLGEHVPQIFFQHALPSDAGSSRAGRMMVVSKQHSDVSVNSAASPTDIAATMVSPC